MLIMTEFKLPSTPNEPKAVTRCSHSVGKSSQESMKSGCSFDTKVNLPSSQASDLNDNRVAVVVNRRVLMSLREGGIWTDFTCMALCDTSSLTIGKFMVVCSSINRGTPNLGIVIGELLLQRPERKCESSLTSLLVYSPINVVMHKASAQELHVLGVTLRIQHVHVPHAINRPRG